VQENSKELDVSVLVHVSPVREGLQTSLAASGNDGQIYSTPTDYQYHRCVPVSAWTATPTNREGTLPCGHAMQLTGVTMFSASPVRFAEIYLTMICCEKKNNIYSLKSNAEVVLKNRKDRERRERWTTTSHMRKESTRIDRDGHDCSQLEQA
jgi:hypothetical protein